VLASIIALDTTITVLCCEPEPTAFSTKVPVQVLLSVKRFSLKRY
jgi:hypothetical protein